jgi:hypothetical protein
MGFEYIAKLSVVKTQQAVEIRVPPWAKSGC